MAAKPTVHNRKALHDYTILETIEAGLVLTGTEIKSIREGKVILRESYARDAKEEMWLFNAHIAPFQGGNRWNHDPLRPRKLLLHKKEIAELSSQVTQKGLTLVPLRLYLKGGVAKVELALAKGKRLYDKRASIAKRTVDKDIQRAMKQKSR